MKKVSNGLIKDFTTYKLSGKMRDVFFPSNIDELKELLNSLLKYKIIGNGSNLIIDESYAGSFIKLSGFNKIIFDDNVVSVGCGYSLSKLSFECGKKGLSGLEFACGIPGTVGGAIYMNAGAYGKNISDVIKNVTIFDEKYNIRVLDKKDLKLGYRDSIFKKKNYIILEAKFNLVSKKSEDILEEISEIMDLRRSKQPLEYPSAGSVFRNPVGYSAGRLVQKANLQGEHVGDAYVSEKHANFIVNKGHASADDVVKLINLVKDKVKEEFNVDLELEQEILK